MMVSLAKYEKYLIRDVRSVIGYRAAPDTPVNVAANFLHINDLQEDGSPLINMVDISAETIAKARKRLAKMPGE